MNTINGILFAILTIIAITIEVRLNKSNLNGFKKILIEFFGAEIFVNIGFLIFECTSYGLHARFVTQCFIFVLFFPKMLAKIRFYIYIMKH